jgi:peptide/nickel transport system substrate-binding protein
VIGRAFAVALGVYLLAAGCGSSAPSADSGASSGDASAAPSGSTEAVAPDTTAPVDGGTLTFAVANDPINLNPSGSGNDTWYVTRQIVDSLTEQDSATGEVVPWLAQSWQISDDAKSFTFTLRPGVTTSDGTPLTAAVVKANLDDIQAAGAKSAAIAALTGYQGTPLWWMTRRSPWFFHAECRLPAGPAGNGGPGRTR